MKYNQATFIPTTNIEQGDINSINANFNLVQGNWSNFENFNSLLAFGTKYEEADSADKTALTDTLINTALPYHYGIIYSGLTDENIELSPNNTLAVKPGSIIYTIDLEEPLTNTSRYLVIDSPVKMGYNHTIYNGIITFKGEVLNTGTRTIKGPTGASNGNAKFNFYELSQYVEEGSSLLKFEIPVSAVAAKNPEHPFTYSNVYSIKFTSGDEDVNELIIPHKTGIKHEENSYTHSYIYYLYITFDVTSTANGKNLFLNQPPEDTFQLIIW